MDFGCGVGLYKNLTFEDVNLPMCKDSGFCKSLFILCCKKINDS